MNLGEAPLAHSREVPLVARREDLDERRVVGADAVAGGAEALDVEAGDRARQAIVLEQHVVDQVAQPGVVRGTA